ncbi:MAG: hypothetical protein HY553_15575 [Elusimicrobia bacterium]|nr:hypothetical protein [Elusimicrobiota bacterium]
MKHPWLLAALLAASFLSPAFADVPNVPNHVAAKFLADENITYMSRVGQLVVFNALLGGDKAAFDATIGRVTPQQEFDALVARARALDARYDRGTAKSALSDERIVAFFTEQLVALPPSRVGEMPKSRRLFGALLDRDQETFDEILGHTVTQAEFDRMSASAITLENAATTNAPQDKKYTPEEIAAIDREFERLKQIGPALKAADSARLEGIVQNAAIEAAGWTSSLRLQAGLTQGDDGKSAFGGGGMLRFGYGKENTGTVGFQGGAILSGAGGQNKLLDRTLVDEARYYERPYEVWEETRRQVSGLNKVRFAGVSYVSPAIGGVVELEGGVDLAYAHMNTAPEVVRETYINELVRRCYDGDCRREWETRTLSTELLHRGYGQQQSGLGQTIYGAANIRFGKDSDLAGRVEVGKDRFKAFPEASGMSYSGGLSVNLDGFFGLLRGER